MGRTVICGKPSDRQREVYKAVHDGLRAATETMVPGKTTSDVAAATRAAAARYGLEQNFISLFIGHGVGIGAVHPQAYRTRPLGDPAGGSATMAPDVGQEEGERAGGPHALSSIPVTLVASIAISSSVTI